jgi:hypothetical protein
MIYRFKIEIDIQADPIDPWDAETIARDYLRQTIEESPLHDHILEWHTKHVSAYPEDKTLTPGAIQSQPQPERTWQW